MEKEQRIKFVLDHPEMNYQELSKELSFKNGESTRQFCKKNKLPNKRINIQATRSIVNLEEGVTNALKNKKKTLEELSDMFNVPPRKIRETLKILQKNKIIIDNFSDGNMQLSRDMKITPTKSIDMNKYKETEFALGFTCDNHIGSKYERMDVLEALYDKFSEYGVKTVYNGGNWIDGEARFNKYDIYVHGINAQINNFIDKYPRRDGIITEFISGDDHEGWYVQREHVNIGQLMEDMAIRAGRTDLKDLGYMERDIEYKQKLGSSTIRVIHAGGGSSYATSYSVQKYAESLQGGEKPAIVLVGHFHKFDYNYPREVHIVQGGGTQDQTPFLRKKRIRVDVGGCVLWVTQNELGIFTSVKIEWLPFFNKKFYKYMW